MKPQLIIRRTWTFFLFLKCMLELTRIRARLQAQVVAMFYSQETVELDLINTSLGLIKSSLCEVERYVGEKRSLIDSDPVINNRWLFVIDVCGLLTIRTHTLQSQNDQRYSECQVKQRLRNADTGSDGKQKKEPTRLVIHNRAPSSDRDRIGPYRELP